MKELSKDNHLFLTSITRKMNREDAESLAKAVAGLTNKEDKDNADAVLQVAMHANEQLFQMLKEDDVMCDALREFFKDELQDANDNGRADGIKIGKADGTAIGKAEAIIEFLEEKGEVPEELVKVINSQKDLEVLKQWIKFAARAGSIEEFKELIGLVK